MRLHKKNEHEHTETEKENNWRIKLTYDALWSEFYVIVTIKWKRTCIVNLHGVGGFENSISFLVTLNAILFLIWFLNNFPCSLAFFLLFFPHKTRGIVWAWHSCMLQRQPYTLTKKKKKEKVKKNRHVINFTWKVNGTWISSLETYSDKRTPEKNRLNSR